MTGLEVSTRNIAFDFSGIEQRNTAIDGHQPAVMPVDLDRGHVIGYCDPPGHWLVAAREKIVCFNAARYKFRNTSRDSVSDSEIPPLDRNEVADLLAAATAEDSKCITASFHVLYTLTAGE